MKALTLFLTIVALLGSAASGYFYFQIGNSKELLQKKLNDSETRASDLDTQLTTSKAEIETLQGRLTTLDTDLADAKSKLTASEGRNVQLTRDVTNYRNQLDAKQQAEAGLNQKISQLQRELVQARFSAQNSSPEEIEGYKTKIAELEAKVTDLSAQASAVSKVGTTPVAATTGGSSTATVAAPASENAGMKIVAQVISVGPKNSFAVISVGKDNTVTVGSKTAIVRDGNIVAEAVVSEIRDTYVIAQIAPNSIQGDLQRGDIANIVVN